MSIFEVKNVDYEYRSKYQTVKALTDISYGFESGCFHAIIGRSGSGKTTLLSLLAGLDLPTDGEILFDGKATKDIDRSELRRKDISVIYQSFNLFPLLTARENVMYPMQLNKVPNKEAEKRAEELLLSVGLKEKIFKQFPKMMSGGEQQRVAVARALACDSKVILADEPTGNLDSENGKTVINILKSLAHEKGKCVIVITHDESIAKGADRVLRISDGKVSP